MHFDGGFQAKLAAFLHQHQRQIESLGRQRVFIGQLHVDVMGAGILLFLEQAREIGRLAGRHAADENQSVPLRSLAQFRAAGPAHAVEPGFLDRVQFLLQRPFVFL